jgi:DNA-binding transcriptional LysR family regulator
MMRFTLRQISAFDAIARCGSVTAAADEVALSQSAMSMALSELEAHLGVALFHRHGKRLTLNANGRALQLKARSLLRLAQDIERIGALEEEPMDGVIRIAASSTIGAYYLPEFCKSFMDAYPGVRISVSVASLGDVMEKVCSLAVDCGFVESPCNRPTIQVSRLGEDNLTIFAAPDHPIAQVNQVSADDLRAQKWVMREANCSTRSTLTLAIGQGAEPLNIVYETSSYDGVKRMVRAGLGIGCLSEVAIAEEIRRGDLVAINVVDLELKRPLIMLRPTGLRPRRVVETFADHVEAIATKSENERTAARRDTDTGVKRIAAVA